MPAPASKAPASAEKVKAARSEAKEEPKVVTFRKLKIELPATLPNTVAFDVTEVAEAGENAIPLFRLLRTVIGSEQFMEVRNRITEKDVAAEVVDELLVKVFQQYGLSLGE